VDLISQPHRWGEWLDYQQPRLQPLLGGQVTEHMRSADCLERVRELRDAARVVINAARLAPIPRPGSTAPQNARSAPMVPVSSLESSKSPVRPFPGAATTTTVLGPRGGDGQAARLDIEALAGALTTATLELATSAEVATIRECQAPGCGLLFVPRHPARRWCSSWTCGNRTRAARHSQR
jgi:hypothetical protein